MIPNVATDGRAAGHQQKKVAWSDETTKEKVPGFGFPLSRISSSKNKFHHLCAEMGHDEEHPFCEKPLWIREVG